MTDQARSGTQRQKRSGNGRRPHNARKGLEFETLGELIHKIGKEPIRVVLNGKEVEMTRVERSLRLTVDRALKGSKPDLTHILRIMIEHPNLARSHRERKVIFIRGALACV